MATARSRATSILVIRRGGLGDTLLVLPLLRALRRAHPGARLAFAGVREFADVLCHFGAVEEALSTEDLQLWSPELARQRLAVHDLVVGDEPALAGLAVYPARVEPGVPFGLQLVHQAGLECSWPADAWIAEAGGVCGGPIVLAPGSGDRAKCWPRGQWGRLAHDLAADRHALHVVVGPTERERDDPRTWQWPPNTTFIDGVTPVQLAQRLRAARAFVGNDSGPTHLAAMLGLPTVAVFGPTDPAVWAPVGADVRVVARLAGAEWADASQVGRVLRTPVRDSS